MIVFVKEEYEQWMQIVDKYNALKTKATKEMDCQLNTLMLQYGVTPTEFIDETLEHYEEYKLKKDIIVNEWKKELISLNNEYNNESNTLIREATWRTAKSKSLEEFCKDAVATILHHVYEEFENKEKTGENSFILFDNLYAIYEQMLLDPNFFLNDETAKTALCTNKVYELLKRYKTGEVTKDEAEPYKNYNNIRYEVVVNKDVNVEKSTLPNITNFYRAKEAIVTTDQLSRDLFNSMFLPNEMRALTLRGGKKGEIVAQTYVTINYDGLKNFKIFNANNAIEGFDQNVFNAICSLVDAGNEYLTVDMIYKAMRGYKVTGQISETQKEDIMKSIRKLSVLRVAINTSAANELYPDLAEISAESAMLDIDVVKCKYRDTTVENVIKVKESPFMFRYAQALNQVDRGSIENLSCPISGTKENISLQGFLYNRVLLARSQKHLPNLRIILVDRILESIGVNKNTYKKFRTKKSKILATVVKIFDYWKETGYIADYTVETELVGKNPTITKFIIMLK